MALQVAVMRKVPDLTNVDRKWLEGKVLQIAAKSAVVQLLLDVVQSICATPSRGGKLAAAAARGRRRQRLQGAEQVPARGFSYARSCRPDDFENPWHW